MDIGVWREQVADHELLAPDIFSIKLFYLHFKFIGSLSELNFNLFLNK